MITREAMYEAIDRYVEDYQIVLQFEKKEFGVKDLGFREVSYFIWAAKKLKQYIHQNPGVDLYTVTCLFTHRMCEFSCMSSSGVGKHLFSVAESVGEYFIDNVILK